MSTWPFILAAVVSGMIASHWLRAAQRRSRILAGRSLLRLAQRGVLRRR